MRDGDFARARELAGSSRELFDRLGDDRSAATAAMYLGEIASRSGDLALAVVEHCDAIERATSAGAVDVVQRVLYVLGHTLCGSERASIGVRLLATARRLADDGLLAWDQADRSLDLEKALTAARGSLGPRFDDAWRQGTEDDTAGAIALIRSLAI
jgi:hypothetical protein